MAVARPEPKAVVALLLLFAVVTAFNITKAVHIDDRAYLDISRHILQDPLHPMSGRLNMFGVAEPAHSTNQPPLLFYLYALTMGIFGESELALHGVMAVFSLAAILAFHALARRFAARWALATTAMFCLGPAFLPGQNLMTDIPMVALWLCTLLVLLPPRPGPVGVRRYALAAVLIAAACLIKYVSLVLIPILLIDILLTRSWRALWTAGITIAILAAWSLFNIADYGGIHLLARPTESAHAKYLAGSMGEWVLGLGAICPFSIAAIPYLRRARYGPVLLTVCALGGVMSMIFGIFRLDEPVWYSFLRASFVANGALICSVVSHRLAGSLSRAMGEGLSDERRRDVLIALWLAGSAAFIVLFAPFMGVRHLVMVVPVVLLILARDVADEVRPVWRVGAFAATLALGLVLGISDWIHADMYRLQARRIKNTYRDANTIWFVGHWGWQWYAEKAGMEPFCEGESVLKPGDVVVAPTMVPRYRIFSKQGDRLDKIETITVETGPATFVRLMSWWPRWSGYYAFYKGGIPWSVTRMPLEKFAVYRVRDASG